MAERWTKLEFVRRPSVQTSKARCHRNPLSGLGFETCGLMDRPEILITLCVERNTTNTYVSQPIDCISHNYKVSITAV
jgi:hypothetical protein